VNRLKRGEILGWHRWDSLRNRWVPLAPLGNGPQAATLPMWQDCLPRRQRTRKRHKDSYRLMTQHRTPSPLIYHQELAILSRFFNDVDRFIQAATFGEGERFAYTRELMAVLRAVFLGQIEGAAHGDRKAFASPRNAASDNRAQAARAAKARARFTPRARVHHSCG
jgi:hypothetical protein